MFLNLKEQNVIINNLQKLCDVTTIISWQKLCERLPKNIFIFPKKALMFSLPNNSNLKCWGNITIWSMQFVSTEADPTTRTK